ncbi:MAG: hypothetical protein JWN97_2294 [Nocardioides sp.]|nr:hypothetical protein [Nocardioides sp.]
MSETVRTYDLDARASEGLGDAAWLELTGVRG